MVSFMVVVKYLGHAGFEIRYGDTKAFIDPLGVFAMHGESRQTLNVLAHPEEVKHLDMILITHEHPSHCDKKTVEELVEKNQCYVVAPSPALATLGINERLKVKVRAGDRFVLNGVDIEVLNAYHPKSDYPVGYIIRKEGRSILHTGDTYAFTALSRIKADLLLVPIGGGAVMDPIGAHTLVKEMKPKYAIPMHYNTYSRIKQNPEEFTEGLGSSIKPIVLQPGQVFEF